jgi:putative ABC transport system substrate-binding protein
MRRREFIPLLGGAAAWWPLAARAQQPNRVRHIGLFLGLAQSADDPSAGEILRPFQAAMQEAGWVDGNNIRLDYRFGGGDLAKINASAAELVALAPELIYATGLPPVQALRQRTSTIPIVFSLVAVRSASAWLKASAGPEGMLPGLSFGTFRLAANGCSSSRTLLPISGASG